MRRLVSAVVLGGATLALGASSATANTHRQSACKTGDKAGNWEVVLGQDTTKKAADSLMHRAVAKKLKATVEHDLCAKRYEVVVTVATKAEATSTLSRAHKDGFKAALDEKS